MASSSYSNAGLIEGLKRSGVIKSADVFTALSRVDRGNYAAVDPYTDSPQSIGHGVTISAPHMHAIALEYLLPALKQPRANILDVGCGSGYLSVVMARLNDQAKVHGIDIIPNLVDLSVMNTRKAVCTIS
jgi:protein-L-isoaspartate(D-aspartate) O-methyltransferase